MNRALFVLGADVLEDVRIGDERLRVANRKRSGIGARVVDRDVDFQVPEVGAADALGDPRGFAARVAGSLLHAVGLPELATETAEAYETLAFELATDPARLAAIKAQLAANRTTAPLFDTQLCTRNIEGLFEGVLARPRLR